MTCDTYLGEKNKRIHKLKLGYWGILLLYARVLVFLVFVKKDEIKITCPKDIGKISQINMLPFKKEYFLRTKNSSGKGVRYEKKQRSGLNWK